MQIFEFHFNPKNKKDVIFDSFCFEPENVYERRLGSLYMAGLLKNTLPQNLRFLNKLSKEIKEKYYKTISATPEKSLRESLKKANEYLEKIAKEGDVSWLGNLSFAVMTLKNSDINFTKTGDVKIILIRKGQIIDVDQKLKFEDMEPYPLKIFGNIVSGKLAENDIVLILTHDVFNLANQEKLITEIARISMSQNLQEESKRIKNVFNDRRDKLLKAAGLCLLVILNKETLPREKEFINQKKTLKIFSFKTILRPFLKRINLFHFSIKKPTIRIPKAKLRMPEAKLRIAKLKIKVPTFKKPEIKIPTFKIELLSKNKTIVLILSFSLILILGFYIFKKQEEAKIENYQEILKEIEESLNQAETYLMVSESNPKAEEAANALLEESWQKLSPLLKEVSSFPKDFANQVLNTKDSISSNLSLINKITKVDNPELFYEFSVSGYVPHRLIASKGNLHFFSPYAKNISELKEGKETIIPTKEAINLASIADNNLFFFSKTGQTYFLENEQNETESVILSYLDYSFNEFASFKSNLYFLDKNKKKIIKYPYTANNSWEEPQLWANAKNATDIKSMAIDGSVWLLLKGNVIDRYYSGRFQNSIKLNVFPEPKDFSKIYTLPGLPYLYLSEPVQKRILILNKSGQVVRQFQSEGFDNILDFSVSENGKEVYILNGLKVYRIAI